jgi:hypothetical protein
MSALAPNAAALAAEAIDTFPALPSHANASLDPGDMAFALLSLE